MTFDGLNTYLYDAESRVCAVHGPFGMTGYQYDADGNRIGKGSITSMSCDLTANGYQAQSEYVLDAGGGQMSEMAVAANGSEVWQHTNVTAGGALIATYDTTGLHFYLNDALGTRRAQTDGYGVLEQTCQSLPFGDGLNCSLSNAAPTEHHFTGKERDTESGLDYFGARYYASNMGRFMSPDWAAKAEPVPYAKLDNPQSLNLYSYVLNNPLSKTDPDGHCIEDFCVLEAAALVGFAESPAGQRLEEDLEEEGPALAQAASQLGGRLLSKAGELLESAAQKFTGLAKNSERIMEGEANGAAFRKPDLLSRTLNVLGEVKDTAKLNLTNQLKDYMSYAKNNGLSFNLFTKDGTKFSQPLIEAVKANGGKIFQQIDGKWVDVTKKIIDSLPKK